MTAETRGWRYNVTANFVRNAAISLEARMTFIVLKSFDGKNGCYPPLDRLARLLGRGRGIVQQYLSELEQAGHLERAQPKTPDGRFTSKRYFLHETPKLRNPTTGKSTSNSYPLQQLPPLTDPPSNSRKSSRDKLTEIETREW